MIVHYFNVLSNVKNRIHGVIFFALRGKESSEIDIISVSIILHEVVSNDHK